MNRFKSAETGRLLALDEKILSRVPLFASLSKQELSQLAGRLKERRLPEQTILLREGEIDDRIFVILEGQAEIIKSLGEEGERLFGVREQGAIFGEMSLFNREGRRTASVRARTALRLIELPRHEFEDLLQRHPALSMELMRSLSSRLEASENATILDLLEKNRQLSQAYQELKSAQAQIIEKERLERELELARQIQRSVLPRTFPEYPGIQLGALIVPARAVGGDFYDFIPMRGGRIGIVVADVSDKGIPASLFMSMTYSLIRAEAAHTTSALRTLQAVNRHLMQMDVSSMFVTLFYGVLDCSTREFSYVRAGHPPPLILDREGQAVEVPFSPGQPLGIFDQPLLDEQTITIPQGGLVLIYSDGLTEASDDQDREFGTEGVQDVIRSHPGATAQEICDRLWERVIAYSGEHGQQDDVTLLCLKSVSR